ncbi:thermonuclease family protein [Niveispirillum sp. KHB5.9]|uniref:thermonuclease family protein n=1 Tax=Niveispirillum sp. KHB5.9 TaxID=3400269 RepID=UPI003A880CB8
MSRPSLPLMMAMAALLALGAVPSLAVSRMAGPMSARVTEVVDGDTLGVRVAIWLDQEVTTRVRVDGIDTPESRSDCADEKRMAQAAKQKLAALVAPATEGKGDGSIRLHDVEYDKYGGRVRARVTLADGTDLAQAMIRAGHARPYQGGKRQPWCAGM